MKFRTEDERKLLVEALASTQPDTISRIVVDGVSITYMQSDLFDEISAQAFQNRAERRQ